MPKITVIRPNFMKVVVVKVVVVAATVVVIVVLLGRIAPYENYSRDIPVQFKLHVL